MCLSYGHLARIPNRAVKRPRPSLPRTPVYQSVTIEWQLAFWTPFFLFGLSYNYTYFHLKVPTHIGAAHAITITKCNRNLLNPQGNFYIIRFSIRKYLPEIQPTLLNLNNYHDTKLCTKIDSFLPLAGCFQIWILYPTIRRNLEVSASSKFVSTATTSASGSASPGHTATIGHLIAQFFSTGQITEN